MHTDLTTAMTSAQAISLHCTEGVSDKIYNIQMRPYLAGAKKDTVFWEVLAQNGRRDGTMTPRVKGSALSLRQAQDLFSVLVSEKTTKTHYVTVPNRDESLKFAAVVVAAVDAHKAPREVANLPSWPGIREMHLEALEYLADNTKAVYHGRPLLAQVLAEVAYGCAEGLDEAIILLSKPNGLSAVEETVSFEVVQGLKEHKLNLANCVAELHLAFS